MSPRTLRRIVARLLVGVLVYAQLAVAAYACMSASPGATGVQTGGDSAMVDHGGQAQAQHVDPDQPALCVAHCRKGQQNVGAEPMPIPPLALATGYFTLEPMASSTSANAKHMALAGSIPPIADPPQRTLHCCLRI